MMGVGAKRALGLYRSCAPRQISVTILAVIHAVFAGFTALVGAFANGGDVWQRLLVVLLHPLGATGLLLLVLRPCLATTKVLAMGARSWQRASGYCLPRRVQKHKRTQDLRAAGVLDERCLGLVGNGS